MVFLVASPSPDPGLSMVTADASGARTVASVDGPRDLFALARHPRLPLCYGVEFREDGRVVVLSTAPRLELVQSLPLRSAGLCHVAVNGTGSLLAVADYVLGRVDVFRLTDEGLVGDPWAWRRLTGSGPDPERQSSAHPHSVLFTEDHALVVADLGTDTLTCFDLTRPGPMRDIWTVPCPPGSGPRHTTALPGPGDMLAVTFELSSQIALVRPSEGVLSVAPATHRTSGLDAGDGLGGLGGEDGRGGGDSLGGVSGVDGLGREESVDSGDGLDRNYPSTLCVDGSILYVANRGADSVSVWRAEGDVLEFLWEVGSGGAWPEHMDLSGRTLAVANARSGQVAFFALSSQGEPTDTGLRLALDRPSWITASLR